MRRLAALLLLVATSCTANVETEPVESDEEAVVSSTPGVAIWTKTFGGADSVDPLTYQEVTDLATDARGYSIVSGRYVRDLRVDGKTFTSATGRAFIASLDGYGKLRWLRELAGDEIYAGKVAVDSAGNVIANGSCSGTADLGGGAFPCAKNWLASFTVDGAFRWAHAIGASASSLSAGAGQTTALVAQSSVDVDLGNGVVVPGNMPSCRMNCQYQTVLATFDSAGNPKWWRTLNPFRGAFQSVRVDDAGVVIGGAIIGSVDLDGDGDADANQYPDGGLYRGAVVARYRHDGALAWSKTWGTADNHGRGISVVGTRSDGEIVVAGSFSGTLDVDGTTLTNPYTDASDIFIVRLRPDGTKLWAKRLGGSSTGSRYVVAADIDVDGHVAVVGTFSKSIYIGSSLYSKSEYDMFLAKFTPKTGATAWKKGFDGATPKALHVTPNNQRILVAGAIDKAVDFGKGTITPSGEDGFVTRFNP